MLKRPNKAGQMELEGRRVRRLPKLIDSDIDLAGVEPRKEYGRMGVQD